MKHFSKIIILILLVTSPCLMAKDPRIIDVKTEKVGEAVHWKPDVIEVTPGETVIFAAKHELEGGFDFHGLNIPVLKVSEKVLRNTLTESKPIKVPATLKPGKYPIGCQFHSKHVPATLVVKATFVGKDAVEDLAAPPPSK